MRFIIQLFTGYVKIEISGFGAEMLLNRAASVRIVMRRLCYKRRKITGFISVRDFKKLPALKRGTGTHISIIEKHGLPFVFRHYHGRIGLPIGAAVFIAVLLILPRFVWSVEFSGNRSVSDEQLLAACEQLGIRQGMLKSRLDPAVNAQRLLLKTQELSWAALNLEGSVLTVNVSEVDSEKENDSAEPCDLRASADGTITKLDITAGEPAVRVGDTVRKGDILVSGIIENSDSTDFVRAAGIVTARTRREFSADGTYFQVVEKYTGKQKIQRVISVFGIDIPLFLGNAGGKYDENRSSCSLVINGRKLPLTYYELSCRFKEQHKVSYSEEKLKEQLADEIEKQVKNLQLENCRTVSESFEKTDNGLRLIRITDSTENIAAVERLLISGRE